MNVCCYFRVAKNHSYIHTITHTYMHVCKPFCVARPFSLALMFTRFRIVVVCMIAFSEAHSSESRIRQTRYIKKNIIINMLLLTNKEKTTTTMMTTTATTKHTRTCTVILCTRSPYLRHFHCCIWRLLFNALRLDCVTDNTQIGNMIFKYTFHFLRVY